MPTPEQDAWIFNLLQVSATAPPAPKPHASRLTEIFASAKERLDAKLNGLDRALRAEDDEVLTEIADLGLFSVTDRGQMVKLMAKLRDFDNLGRDPGAGQAVRKAVADYREAVLASRIIDLFDDNPFGAEVGLRSELSSALDDIEAALAGVGV